MQKPNDLRMMPHSTDVENTILASMMYSNTIIDTVSSILKTESFYSTANQLIFNAITKLHGKGRVPDLVAVVEFLKSENSLPKAGDVYGVGKVYGSVTSSADIEGKCRVILEKYLKRQLIEFSSELANECFENGTDAFDILDNSESTILQLSTSHLNNDYTDLKSSMVKMVKRIEMLQHLDEDITGVPTGFNEMDRITHGWQEDNLIVIAARPSVGKSAFGLNLARYAAMSNLKPTNVGFFSLEMNTNQLVQRIISAQSEVFLTNIKTGKINHFFMNKLITDGVMKLEKANIYIDDTASLTITQLRSKCRRMVMKDDVGLIIIDYLQLLEGDKSKNRSGNREQEISGITRELKKLSKQLHVPIIALAQLSREVEKRNVKIPQLSDLRESGAIEQDADMVLFLYRPSVEERNQDADLKRSGTVTIAKHRDGELESFLFDIDDRIQKWTEVGVLGQIPVSAPSPGFNFKPLVRDYTEPKTNDDAPF